MIQVETTHIWLALIAIAPILISSVTAAILALRGTKQASQMLDLAKDTHTLVNSNMGATLESYSVLARRMANITNLPEDSSIADDAEAKYDNHVAQQSIVNERQEERDARSGP